jgi:hypothetical protein
MESSIIDMMNIEKSLIPSSWMLGFVHAQDMHDHPIDEFSLAINLGVEGISVQK